MDIKILSRCVAYVTFAGALIATAIALNDRHYPTTRASRVAPTPSPGAPDAELARCKAIGAEAADDAVCNGVWKANRERFFHSETRYPGRITDVPATFTLKEPESRLQAELSRRTPQLSSAHNANAYRPLADSAGQPQ